MLPREFLHDAMFRSRFEREAKLIAALEDPAIVPVYDFGEEAGQPCLVMRYMAGGSLSDRLQRGSLSLGEAAGLLARIAPALDNAHRSGVIHRDLKPANILFDRDGNPYIADFGIAKLLESSASFTSTGIIGTPAYMSPEQVEGERTLDGRSDVYALGIILYQMLAGKPPYDADTPMSVALMHLRLPVPHVRQAAPGLPVAVDQVVATALAKDREQRYATAVALAAAMSRAADSSVPPTRLAPPPQRAESRPPLPPPPVRLSSESGSQGPSGPSPSARRFRWTAPLLALVGALAVVVVLILINLGGGGSGQVTPTPTRTNTLTSPPPATDTPAPPTDIPVPSTDTPIPPTPTPMSDAVVRTDGDMVFVPAGEFTMGSPDGQGYSGEHPQHTVYLNAFSIDKTEVTAAQYQRCVEAGACSAPATGEDCTYGAASKSDHPVNCVDWDQAVAFCRWAGKRLPAEAEWEKAARGTDGRVYPWGDQAPDSTLADFTNNVGSTTSVGQYPAGASPYGALDMAGNVWEWVADWYGESYYSQSPSQNPQGPASGHTRVLRGGSWSDDPYSARVAVRNSYVPGSGFDLFGFRCARSP